MVSVRIVEGLPAHLSLIISIVHHGQHFILLISQRHVKFSIVFSVEVDEWVDALFCMLFKFGHLETLEMFFVVDVCSYLSEADLGLLQDHLNGLLY